LSFRYHIVNQLINVDVVSLSVAIYAIQHCLIERLWCHCSNRQLRSKDFKHLLAIWTLLICIL